MILSPGATKKKTILGFSMGLYKLEIQCEIWSDNLNGFGSAK